MVYRGDGYDHKNFCHDFLVHYDTENFFVGAVLDGCTGGVHSQFASSLFGKIFNLILRSRNQLKYFASWSEPIDVAAGIMYEFCKELVIVKQSLALSNNELLCTILLEVYSKEKDKLFVIGFGDGYVHVNGVGHKIENTKYGDTVVDGVLKEGKNKPDYLIDDIELIMGDYDIDLDENARRHRFEEWFLSKQPTFEFTDVNDFSIATDGILSFRDKEGRIDYTDNAVELFLKRSGTDYGGLKNAANLTRKMNAIRDRKDDKRTNPDMIGAVNTDDVSLIRVTVEKVPVEA